MRFVAVYGGLLNLQTWEDAGRYAGEAADPMSPLIAAAWSALAAEAAGAVSALLVHLPCARNAMMASPLSTMPNAKIARNAFPIAVQSNPVRISARAASAM